MGGYYELTGSTVTKYYFAGTQRAAMRKYTVPSSMAVEYFLSDHLGSTSITTDVNGTKVSETRYKPWGEVRFSWTAGQSTTPAYLLPNYTFTGQYSHMDDPSTAWVTEGFGLMFYVSRMYDPALGRFIQADSIVPGGVQGLDRYAYVNNAPTRFTDPSGHRCFPANECDTPHGDKPVSAFLTDIPDSLKGSPYQDAFIRGMGFVNQLLSHKGWWTSYLNSNDSETVWKFLLTLAYLFESYSYSQMPDWNTFKQYMTDSIVNKVGDLYNDYGIAGFYIYIGGREALFKARGQYENDDPRWIEGTPEYMNTWDLSYLGIEDTYIEATTEIDNSWELITSYTGTSYYGTNAYDCGVAPPFTIDKTKLVWQSLKIVGRNPWTGNLGPYWLFFISK